MPSPSRPHQGDLDFLGGGIRSFNAEVDSWEATLFCLSREAFKRMPIETRAVLQEALLHSLALTQKQTLEADLSTKSKHT